MANYRKIRWFYDQWNDVLLDSRGQQVREVHLTRNDVLSLEVQVFSGGQFAIDSVGLIGSGIGVDMTDYANFTVGIKSGISYRADGAFDEALSGYDTTNTVHSLVNGRAAALLLFASAPGDYYLEAEFRTSSGSPWSVPGRPIVAHLHRDVIIGTESNMPSGVTASVSGNASISDTATDSGAISVSGMTSGGQVIVGLLAPTGSPTEPTYWLTYATGSFTIHVSVAPGSGNAYNFRWTLVRKS